MKKVFTKLEYWDSYSLKRWGVNLRYFSHQITQFINSKMGSTSSQNPTFEFLSWFSYLQNWCRPLRDKYTTAKKCIQCYSSAQAYPFIIKIRENKLLGCRVKLFSEFWILLSYFWPFLGAIVKEKPCLCYWAILDIDHSMIDNGTTAFSSCQ